MPIKGRGLWAESPVYGCVGDHDLVINPSFLSLLLHGCRLAYPICDHAFSNCLFDSFLSHSKQFCISVPNSAIYYEILPVHSYCDYYCVHPYFYSEKYTEIESSVKPNPPEYYEKTILMFIPFNTEFCDILRNRPYRWLCRIFLCAGPLFIYKLIQNDIVK